MEKIKNIILVLLLSGSVIAQNNTNNVYKAYKGGESLKYSLNYGFIKGGYITFSVEDAELNNQKVYHTDLFVKTSGFVDAIFKVRDRYESYINPKTNQPLRSVRNIREGRYRYYNEVDFYYEPVVNDSVFVISKKSGRHNVPRNIQDIVSAFYFARNFNFNDNMKKGELISFITFFADEIFPLNLRYIRTEKVKTKFGKIECYLFYPVTEVGRLFDDEDDMRVWISKDKNHIPIRVEADMVVGSFTCKLVEFKGLANSFSGIVE